ncbi:PLP-dependent transferase [Vibrio metschnikovii]
MEVQDIPTLARIAHQHNIIVMDNVGYGYSVYGVTTWYLTYRFNDDQIHWRNPPVAMPSLPLLKRNIEVNYRENRYLMGQMRTLMMPTFRSSWIRTLAVRLRHQQNTLTVANWLATHPLVDEVRHPACRFCQGHEFFQRDFTGGQRTFLVCS